MKGLRVAIYTAKHSAGAHEHGPNVFAAVGMLTIVGIREGSAVKWLPRKACVFAPEAAAPAAVLVRRHLFGYQVWHVEPLEPGQYMASGAYVATSDSRLGEITSVYGALALHDRQES